MATSKQNGPGFSVPVEKQEEIVKAQRDFIDSIAERIEKGEPFSRAGERNLVGGILRAWARQLPDSLPNTQGGAASIDPGYAAIHFACLVNVHGRSKDAATAELAGLYGATPEEVAAAIERFEAPAMRLVPKKTRARPE
jgi:hypothetical protein